MPLSLLSVSKPIPYSRCSQRHNQAQIGRLTSWAEAPPDKSFPRRKNDVTQGPTSKHDQIIESRERKEEEEKSCASANDSSRFPLPFSPTPRPLGFYLARPLAALSWRRRRWRCRVSVPTPGPVDSASQSGNPGPPPPCPPIRPRFFSLEFRRILSRGVYAGQDWVWCLRRARLIFGVVVS